MHQAFMAYIVRIWRRKRLCFIQRLKLSKNIVLLEAFAYQIWSSRIYRVEISYPATACARIPHYPRWSESRRTSSSRLSRSSHTSAAAGCLRFESSRVPTDGPEPPAAGPAPRAPGTAPSRPGRSSPGASSGPSSWPRWAPAADGCTARRLRSPDWPPASRPGPETSPVDLARPPTSSARCLTSQTWWWRWWRSREGGAAKVKSREFH